MFLYAIVCNYISFFGTNLLTQCLVLVAVFCFFGFQRNSTKWSPNATKIFGDFFLHKRNLGSFRRRPEASRRLHKATGHAPGGRRVALWGPHDSVWPNSTSINSKILENHQRARRNNLSAAASLCSSAIPFGGLFRYSAGGGIDHGGLLHQPCCPFDDVWVVYHRPTGP